MSALPIEPTRDELRAAVASRGSHIAPVVAAFQLGIEAERARAGAETTELSERDREVAHADWHGQEGNLLGADDCEWEGCAFISHAEFIAGHLDACRDERREAKS